MISAALSWNCRCLVASISSGELEPLHFEATQRGHEGQPTTNCGGCSLVDRPNGFHLQVPFDATGDRRRSLRAINGLGCPIGGLSPLGLLSRFPRLGALAFWSLDANLLLRFRVMIMACVEISVESIVAVKPLEDVILTMRRDPGRNCHINALLRACGTPADGRRKVLETSPGYQNVDRPVINRSPSRALSHSTVIIGASLLPNPSSTGLSARCHPQERGFVPHSGSNSCLFRSTTALTTKTTVIRSTRSDQGQTTFTTIRINPTSHLDLGG